MTTQYNSSSSGPVEIASMNYNHLLNAHDKLAVTEPHRTAEIQAMRARMDALEAEQADQVAK